MQMTNIDRSWIIKHLLSDKITQNPEYRNDVEEFMKFASVNGM